MLKYRLISFFILLSLLTALFYLDFTHQEWGKTFFTLLAAAAAVPASFEFTIIIKRTGVDCFHFLFPGLFASAVLLLAAFCPWQNSLAISFFAIGSLLVMFLWSLILGSGKHPDFPGKAAGACMVFIFISLLVFSLWRIHEAGPVWFLFFVAATKACDTGGYIAGMLSNKLMKNGNHKLIPSISPKKSWEGLAGGLILSLAAGVGFGLSDPFGIGLTATVVISFFLSLGSLAGDLSESALKRAADIKDSGNWIPGMGGILDVVDSFIYNAPVLAVSLAVAGI